MSKAKTLMYAELLPNIRQITIIAELKTPCDAATNGELSANGQRITLHHDGVTTLNLPAQVALHAHLQRPAVTSKELSWRLPVRGTASRNDAEIAQNNEAPWSAMTLGEDAEFLCRKCDAVIVEKGAIKNWKDLPSENWAEMMDFWHCHKPSDHEGKGPNGPPDPDQDIVTAIKGYGANTRFAAQKEVGFVDLTTILLANTDFSNVEVRYVFCDFSFPFYFYG